MLIAYDPAQRRAIDVSVKDREKYYLGTPKDNQNKILSAQNRLGLRMMVQATAPVSTALQGFYFLYLFLQSTFLIIVFFMALLSVMLIYSLMIPIPLQKGLVSLLKKKI